MATLVLQLAGAAIGSALGGPVGGAIGRAVGGVLGASIDGALIAPRGRPIEGPRLTEMAGLSSTEGAPVPRVYGRARLGGELIWATRFEEVVNVTRQRGGGIGGKGGLFGGGPTQTTYSYFANFAVGLCEGEIAFVRRIWADGKPLDLTTLTLRVHRGDEGQEADPLIVAKEGAENAPAYRGLAYVVFERLPLADFGNRIPQLAFEIVRPVGRLNAKVRGINLIPGAGEFAYDGTPVFQNAGDGVSRAENVNQQTHAADIAASLDQLQALCPNLESVTLIATWFGDDLRVGQCTVRPKAESAGKITTPHVWRVAGVERGAAAIVSQIDGRPAYGGTPSDESVLSAIAAIKARGWKINLHPFIMMDIPTDNALVDPRSGVASQPAYPWRGDLTVDPAPGAAGTVDGSGAAATQIAAFVGTAAPAHFSVAGSDVVYSGPTEWSLRRFILHYAKLATIAGGVDGFILSSELRSLTRVRGADGAYPMTTALVAVAADARALIGPATTITYAADWTEYGGVVPEPGSLLFPLDALWASPDIDAVGIDWYAPLSDWRDGVGHLDAAIANGSSDAAYLTSRVASGEGFDWYYADDAGREAQERLPISDGAYGKPWVYRVKDIVGWWSNAHVERSGGVETTTTAWTPRGKPIWLMEVGCPAVDRGGNAPNLFPDAKSSAAALPPFSRGARDDLISLRAIDATLSRFDSASPDAAAFNPPSTIYGGRMIDASRTHLWAWDARPFPAFPALRSTWGDSENYELGHWLNGRLEGAPLDDLVAAIAADFETAPLVSEGLDAFVAGYVIDRPMSLRATLEPLAALYGFGLRGDFALVGGRRAVAATLTEDDLAADRDGRTMNLTRAQETELPAEATIGFSDGENEYRRASVASRRLAGSSRRQSYGDAALIGRRAEMQRLADMRLQETWTARETVRFALPPARLDIEAGDRIRLKPGSIDRLYEVQRIADGATREIEARAVDDSPLDHVAPEWIGPELAAPAIPGAPRIVVLDLPIAKGAPAALQHVAAFADPWPGSLTIWRKQGATDFVAERAIATRATIGALLDPLPPGPMSRWDRAASFRVTLTGGSLSSIDDDEALAGENAFAVQKPDGAWEILIAAQATLVAPKTYRLSRLLRGLGGSEDAAAATAAAGATIIKLDGAATPLADSVDALATPRVYRIGPATLDYADARYVELTTLATSLAMKPLSPVHLRARREAGGVAFSWIRRTRIDGDAWGLDEVPLGEDGERYELDVRSGATVLRTLASSTPTLLYPAAQELADFGAPQNSIEIGLAQLSAVAGRGFIRRQTVSIA